MHNKTKEGLYDIAIKESSNSIDEIGRAVQQECRDRYRMPSSA